MWQQEYLCICTPGASAGMDGAGIEVLDLMMVIATSELAARGVKGEEWVGRTLP